MANDRQSQGTSRSGTGRAGEDSTTQPGQYPSSLFGMSLPQGTGAGGAPGGTGDADATLQPGNSPSTDAYTGVQLPHGGDGSATQPPGSAGRQAGDQRVGGAAVYQEVGSTIYGSTAADHAMHQDGPRSDGQYPPTTETEAVKAPKGTGAGGGTVRGASHPNAGR